MDTGRSLLSTAKSASGVGASIHPTTSSKLDKQSSRRLLEMFDRKKNWVFHGLGGDDEEKEDIISEDNWTNGEKQLFRDPYRRSERGGGEFHSGRRAELPDKNGRNRNSRQKDPTRLRPEEDEEDRLNRDETKLDLGLTQRVERTGLAFRGNSPFSTRTALDSSPFARRKTGSSNPFESSAVPANPVRPVRRLGVDRGRPSAKRLAKREAEGQGRILYLGQKPGNNRVSLAGRHHSPPMAWGSRASRLVWRR